MQTGLSVTSDARGRPLVELFRPRRPRFDLASICDGDPTRLRERRTPRFWLSLCLALRHLLESFSLANSPVADFPALIAAAKLDGLRYRTISGLGKSVTVVGERTYTCRNRDGSGSGGRLHDGSKAPTDLMSAFETRPTSAEPPTWAQTGREQNGGFGQSKS
jgi:hypothetical protein